MLRLFLVAMLAFATPAKAQIAPAAGPAAEAEAPAELVSALIEHWRVAEMLTAMQRALLQADFFDSIGDANVREATSAAWAATTHKVLDVESMLAAIRSDIARSFTASDLEWHRNFYRSELGQQLVRLERYRFAEVDPQLDAAQSIAHGLSGMTEVQEELDADPARARALSRLIAATGGEEAYIEALLSIATNLIQTAAAAAPAGEAATQVEALIRVAEQYRPMVSLLVQPMILPAFATLYEPLATRDIDAFAAELETPQGKRMTSGLFKLASRTLTKIVVDFGAEFMRQSQVEAAK